MKTLLYWGVVGLTLTGVAGSCIVSYQVGYAHGLERAQGSAEFASTFQPPMPSHGDLHSVEQDLNPPSQTLNECP